MVCQYCRKRIGILRRTVDKQFCSVQHRNAYSTRSARALREMGELTYSAADVLRDTDEIPIPSMRRRTSSSRSSATVLGLAALAIAALVLVEKAGVSGSRQAPKSKEPEVGVMSQWMGKVVDSLPRSAAGGVVIEDRFNAGLRNWLSAPGATGMAGWKVENGMMRPGGLRIWDESRKLADYSFEFEGRVESNSLGWVIRAANHRNYYAAKLAIPDSGSTNRPEIIRFAVIQGHESRRQHMPIPVEVDRGTFYQVQVRAVGDRILTVVGGRVVDQWRDARFRTGGVGFFSERGDKASIRWAKLNEGESIADKLRAYLTFGLVIPAY